MTGYKSKKAAASAKTIAEVNWADHEPDGRRVAALDRVLYNDWEHRNTLENGYSDSDTNYAWVAWQAALAQPAQEPVAWMHLDGRVWTFGRGLDKSTFTIPLYTAPQQRPWVGLTDEEIKAVNAQVSQIPPIDYTTTTYAKAIEAKLKEKNNGT